MAEGVALTQDELDRILNNVRNDNTERESKPVSSGIALSQADLDRLFGGGSSAPAATKAPEPASPAPAGAGQPAAAAAPLASEPAQATAGVPGGNAAAAGSADADAARAAKIAERKARAAEMLARVNASSPKRITVVYGSTLRRGSEISALAAGDLLELDRSPEEAAEIQVDGKPFAYGRPGVVNGRTAIKITRII